MSRGTEKANQYVPALYEARCSGNWQAVPELARKVEKHAPSRKLLALSSRAGAQIYESPSPVNYRTANQEYGSQLSELLPTTTDIHREDSLDGAVCRAAILLGTAQYDTVLTRFPDPLHALQPPSSGTGRDGWEAVCVIQGTLIRGIALEHVGEYAAASQTYRSSISYVSNVLGLPSLCHELSRWTEELLCQICVFFSSARDNKPAQLGEAMAGFHLLSKYLDSQGWKSLSSTPTFARYRPRSVWRAYYEALSRTVRDALVYHPSPIHRDHETLEHRGLLDDDDFLSSRMQQRADLRRVETYYENLLLTETDFPRAGETNQEVKAWVESVMGNWRVLCGPTWTNQELGAGGKLVVGRTTLEILYRAATKTFHSTQILRHLFTVHTYLGEFDLALKAFDSYVEIMTRGKARAEKSGDSGLDIDDDATAIQLSAEAIRVSCRYGSPDIAEKTLQIGERLESWLETGTSKSSLKQLRDSSQPDQEVSESQHHGCLPVEVLSLAYSAVGISQANYARFAFSPTVRAEHHAKAIKYLRLSANLDVPTGQVESMYALSMVLAETRDVTEATDIIRAALNSSGGAEALSEPGGASIEQNGSSPAQSPLEKFAQRKRLLPVWHLLAQLLCAREDYSMALQCCQVALEQFKSTASLVANDPSKRHTRNKTSLSGLPSKIPASTASDPAVELMEPFEKQTVIEMKMTQLSLIEVMEGPETAVNACNELFSLFTRLFGFLDAERVKRPQTAATLPPPRSSASTIRNVFGRNKAGTLSSLRHSTLSTANPSAMTSRPGTSTTAAPTIQVTNANGAVTPARESTDTRPNMIVKKKISGSIRRHGSTKSRPDTARSTARPSMDVKPTANNAQGRGVQDSVDGAITSLSNHITDAPAPLPSSHTPSPAPHFLKLQEFRHKFGVLIQIWLFVARLYTDAAIFDDAAAAVEEANKLVAELESTVAQSGASVRLFQERGWGGWKSIEDLWADVCSQRGRLLLARSQPHDALPQLERALSHSPDHAEATVTLSNILLDIYAEIIPAEKPNPNSLPFHAPSSATTAFSNPDSLTRKTLSDSRTLNRIAARDRAYGLLAALTKLGSGWDDSEAWFALARAYEESAQVDKAKDALWWCVHLEDTKPIRHWRHVSPGGHVL